MNNQNTPPKEPSDQTTSVDGLDDGACYASLPVTDVIERILELLYDCPRNSDCRNRLERIKDGIFLELPETRTALLCQVGMAINEHVPSGKTNDQREDYWMEIRDLLTAAFSPHNAERIHGGAGQPNQPETPTPLDGASC